MLRRLKPAIRFDVKNNVTNRKTRICVSLFFEKSKEIKRAVIARRSMNPIVINIFEGETKKKTPNVDVKSSVVKRCFVEIVYVLRRAI